MKLRTCDCSCCFECTGIRDDERTSPDDGVRMPEREPHEQTS